MQIPKKQGLYDPRWEHDSCGIGFLAQMEGKKSHRILDQAAEMTANMSHRSASGAEPNSGDGAGIMTALPHDFFSRILLTKENIRLPNIGDYAAGIVFLPKDTRSHPEIFDQLKRIIKQEKLEWLAQRNIPQNSDILGISAGAREPFMLQIFIAKNSPHLKDDLFERQLFSIRKQITHVIRKSKIDPDDEFYICSLSHRTLVYKGMLTPSQLFTYFSDLNAPDYRSHFALVHTRFATNTFPNWKRAQPLRYICHNGEINSLRGNVNRMNARQGQLASSHFPQSLEKLLPVIEADNSDSGCFDNSFEFNLMAGQERSAAEVAVMMVPEALALSSAGSSSSLRPIDKKIRDMHNAMAMITEPWDGPAAICFCDGKVIGALLDRNGLRPARYYLTNDNLCIFASEAGVIKVPNENIMKKGRIKPGGIFLIDFAEKTFPSFIKDDFIVKSALAKKYPYDQWLKKQVRLQDILLTEVKENNNIPSTKIKDPSSQSLYRKLRLFHYTREHIDILIKPISISGKETLGSMGNDTPLAVLSTEIKLLYDYFKQLFAQVTNPPIDSIRERAVMSLASSIGKKGNWLMANENQYHQLYLSHPILLTAEIQAIKKLDHHGFSVKTIDCTFAKKQEVADTLDQLSIRLAQINQQAKEYVKKGVEILILSDQNTSAEKIPIDMLLAVGSIHQHLIQQKLRNQVGLILESAEPREVHHFCALLGYGADAIYPSLVWEILGEHVCDGNDLHMMEIKKENTTSQAILQAHKNYRLGIGNGILKVIAKMGISKIDSYKGSQLFECVGIGPDVIEKYFTGTSSRIGGITIRDIARITYQRHQKAYPPRPLTYDDQILDNPGHYQWRKNGTTHLWDPKSIALLQNAVRFKKTDSFAQFSQIQDQASTTLRSLLFYRKDNPIPINQVETISSICRRFVSGAMSLGSISQETHETLAIAMNYLGSRSNSGEGGEDSRRYHKDANGDDRGSKIKQIASGRFGVTIQYLTHAQEIQIKMAQGAKPGEGGELPKDKVFDLIAQIRHSTPGVGLISPPPHHDIYSIEDLAQLIFDLKNANPLARISVKLVSEVGVGTIAAGVAKAHADHILISGHDGGTGASPLTGIKHAGFPWELGLAETHQTLLLNNLRDRVILQTDGQIKTARDVIIAALLGADEFGFGTTALINLGCVMMRVCHQNTCPVGIATQDHELRKKFTGEPEHVIRYFTYLAENIRQELAQMGIRNFDSLVGRSDLLQVKKKEDLDSKIQNNYQQLDLSALLYQVKCELRTDPYVHQAYSLRKPHPIGVVLDHRLIELIKKEDERKIEMTINNRQRAVGTLLSNYLTLHPQQVTKPRQIKFNGTAGQSFAAWLTEGLQFELEGDANDYVGKGLSGGEIIIYPPRNSTFLSEENIIIGNVAFYGATSGSAFICGQAAERFCVRNSGAEVVVEGLGSYGCEYMTGGRAIILHTIGRNFGAGMSGGIAYIWHKNWQNPNIGDYLSMTDNEAELLIEEINANDEQYLKSKIEQHLRFTNSSIAATIMEDWDSESLYFKRIIPLGYKNIIERSEKKIAQAMKVIES